MGKVGFEYQQPWQEHETARFFLFSSPSNTYIYIFTNAIMFLPCSKLLELMISFLRTFFLHLYTYLMERLRVLQNNGKVLRQSSAHCASVYFASTKSFAFGI